MDRLLLPAPVSKSVSVPNGIETLKDRSPDLPSPIGRVGLRKLSEPVRENHDNLGHYPKSIYTPASTEAFLLRTAMACCSSSKSNGLVIIMSTFNSS